MAKGGGARKGGAAPLSLRGMYGHRLDAIRDSFQTSAKKAAEAAIQAGADNAELARIQAKATRQAATRDYDLMLRTFRTELATLKKNGLLPADVDVRKARPTVGFLARIRNNAMVAQKRQRAVKVSKARAKELKEEGYEIKRGRVVVSPEFKVSRKGEVSIKTGDGFSLRKRVYLTADPEAIERNVNRIFDGMGPDDVVVISIGDNLTEFYTREGRGDFLAKLLAYQQAKYPMRYVDIVKMPEEEVDEWTADHTHERLERQGGMRKTRRNERARDRRTLKRERTGAPGKGKHIRTPKFPPR